MLTSTATVEQGGRSVLEGRSSDGARFKGGGVMRFLYATGSRPLDGYTIKRGIGRGGFGEVYFALSDAGKEVALKCIQQGMDVEIRGVSQCLNIKHPNLIGLFDIRYDEDGQPWVVMEYVAGQTLRDVLEQAPTGLPLDQVQTWFQQMTAAVSHLHQHGIVHRDLKPGNVFLDAGFVKIGDYGLSKYIATSRRSGHTESVGTFHYMAPEIGRGVYGKEIDLYALGIVLYEMLTGQLPFQGESSQEIMMKHLTAEPDLTGVPVPFRTLLSKALRKDPKLRFQSVEELQAAFTAAMTVALPAAQQATQATAPVAAPPLRSNPRSPTRTQLPFGHQIVDDGIALGPLRQVVTAAAPVAGAAPPPLRNAPRGRQEAVPPVMNHGGLGAAAQRHEAGSPGTAEPLVIAEIVSKTPPGEPIAAALGHGWRRLTAWWHDEAVSNPLKAVVLLGSIAFVALNAVWLAPVVAILGPLYAVYYLLFQVTVGTRSHAGPTKSAGAHGGSPQARWRHHSPSMQAPTQAAYHPVAYQAARGREVHHQQQLPPGARRAAKRERKRSKRMLRKALATKPLGQRLAELNGSFLSAAIVAGVVSFGTAWLCDFSPQNEATFWAFVTWLALSSMISVWCLLAFAQFTPATDETPSSWGQRGLLAVSGAVLGGLFALLASFLELQAMPERFATSASSSEPLLRLEAFFAHTFGHAGWFESVTFFAVMLGLLRWLRQADPLRSSRVSLLTIGGCVLTAWIVNLFLPYPESWGILWAVCTSVALQASAPWLTSQQRESMLQSAESPVDDEVSPLAT